MTNEKLNLRLSLSREKLEMAGIMIDAGKYGDSLVFSYLSLFYSIRLLLIDHDEDSDDPGKIIKLAERYFEPSGWNGIDILSTFRETKKASDLAAADPEKKVSVETAREFYHKAASVRKCILEKIGL